MHDEITEPIDVLEFWATAGPQKWWAKDTAFDADIERLFAKTHKAARLGELNEWLQTSEGTLALVIVLDQFSRNLFRNDARAFEQDEQCLSVVINAMETGFDHKLPSDIGMFIYLPLMHSENISHQKLCVREMARLELKSESKFAKIHLDIIEKFGRFPHRNKVLGRSTTPQEQAFLDEGGFSG